MQQKTGGTLAHTSCAMVSLTESLKKACDRIRNMSGKHRDRFSTKRERSDCLKIQVTDLTSQVTKVEVLLCVACSKERIT